MGHGLDLFSTSLFFAFSPSAPPPSTDKRSLLTIDDEWIVPVVSALLPLFCQLGQRQPSVNQKCCLNIYPQMSGMVLSDNIYIWMSPNTLEMITPWLQPHILSRILPWFFFSSWVFIFWTPTGKRAKLTSLGIFWWGLTLVLLKLNFERIFKISPWNSLLHHIKVWLWK